MGVTRGVWHDDDDGASSLTSGLESVHDSISTVPTLVDGASGVRLPDGMAEADAVKVFANYNTRHQYDPNLPITRCREDVSSNEAS
jgi:hypothetical protein